MSPSDDLKISVMALVFLAALGALSFRNHFKKHETIKPHRLPWMIICLGSIATSFMLVVHIVNLLGFETGRM